MSYTFPEFTDPCAKEGEREKKGKHVPQTLHCRKKPERIDPLARSPQGDTALHRAAIHGHEGVVREIPNTANYNKICDMLRYPPATKN